MEFFGKDRREVAMEAEEWRKANLGYDATTSATHKRQSGWRATVWCVICTRRVSCD